MSTLPSRVSLPRLILFGLECRTTRVVLDRLVAAGIDVGLVCLPGPPASPLIQSPAVRSSGALPFVGSPVAERTVTASARRHGIDVWRLGDLRSKRVRSELAAFDADLLVSACFDRLIPESLYAHLPLGGLNLHPSLLPDKRGPDPLFWVFHEGDREAGMTVHRLTNRFDAGPILAQAPLPVPDGISEDELDARLADVGAQLLLDCLPALVRGEARERPQDDGAVSRAPHPGPRDWVIDESWTARRAYNFVRGLEGRGQPISLALTNGAFRVVEALGWRERNGERVAPPVTAIPLQEGVLIARVEPAGAD